MWPVEAGMMRVNKNISVLHEVYSVVNGVEQVKVTLPGSPLNSVVYEAPDLSVRDQFGQVVRDGVEVLRERFPRAYQTYLNGGRPVGTPLTVLNGIGKELESILAVKGIHTVEQLAKSSDATMDALGFGSKELRSMAQDWLKENVEDPQEAMKKELEASTAKTAELFDMVKQLMAENAKMRDETKKLQESMEKRK